MFKPMVMNVSLDVVLAAAFALMAGCSSAICQTSKPAATSACASKPASTAATAGATTASAPTSQRAALPPLKSPRIVVSKSGRWLRVYDGERLAKEYRSCTGGNAGDKEREGDRKTPEGDFYVVYKNPQSKYTLSMGLSYPNQEDADRGLREGLITPEQYNALMEANREIQNLSTTQPAADWEKLWKTPLGGEIMIHGAGANRTGTAGCVGLDDDDIRELYPAIPIGTPVKIQP